MIRRPPRSTLSSSSAASDVYKRQVCLALACFTARSALFFMPRPSADRPPDSGADRPMVAVLLPPLVLPPEDPELSDLLLPQAVSTTAPTTSGAASRRERERMRGS